MHAHDRFLPEWFNRVRSRQITLPRFQRHIAWGHNEVADLLTTVLRGLPSGAALILQVGDAEKFLSRTIVDAPESGERVTEQLLDGQQRITALWRSLHDAYEDRTYLVGFADNEDDGETFSVEEAYVYGEARRTKNGKRFPIWVDIPRDCWERGYIPARLLRPEDISKEADEWAKAATDHIEDSDERYEERDNIKDTIGILRTRVREFNLPYLALPASTERAVALDVFVKMNTSSAKLTTFDIVVALVEDETGESLHDYINELITEVPRIEEYVNNAQDIALDVVALRQDRMPNQAGHKGIDFPKMIEDWPDLIASIKGLVSFLEEESIFDSKRLPSYTPLPVLAALWRKLPTQPDQLGNARHLLKQYIWRAFLTDRYVISSANNAFQDYRKLRNSVSSGVYSTDAPIFSYSLPSKDELLKSSWPVSKTILSRGILALSLKCGADDIADGAKASVKTITSKENPREYHHLFPASTLEEAGLEKNEIYRVLNCALITWRTNRVISNKDPISYLKERSQNSSLGHDEMVRRLKTHLIPYEPLAVGYDGVDDEQKAERVREDYFAFLHKRSEIMEEVIQQACAGKTLQLENIFSKDLSVEAA